VIGAGVSGLTTAICLAEHGLKVRIWSAEAPLATTSVAAGAMWGPYLVEPVDRVRTWSDETLAQLLTLADEPGTGVRLVAGIEASRTPVEPPEWGDRLDGFRTCGAAELPTGFVAGWRYVAPVLDMPTYLAYLEGRLATAGPHVEIRTVKSLAEAGDRSPLVVNCAGLGAHDLVQDASLQPIRGQLVVVENPGINEFFSEDTGPSPDLLHFAPQGDTVVLGGTALPGVWTREPDPATAAAIVSRCAEVEPKLKHTKVVAHRVGLRPTRPTVRVEVESIGGVRVIHNYGHGGAGVTLSWGCAREVTAIAIAR
jgi:D-amino-acid oxidase